MDPAAPAPPAEECVPLPPSHGGLPGRRSGPTGASGRAEPLWDARAAPALDFAPERNGAAWLCPSRGMPASDLAAAECCHARIAMIVRCSGTSMIGTRRRMAGGFRSGRDGRFTG